MHVAVPQPLEPGPRIPSNVGIEGLHPYLNRSNNQVSRIYEGMFLIDNDAVRASWPKAKSLVTDLIQKHGGGVETARRWAERPLAYPIKRKKRATFLLTHFTMPSNGFQDLNRELEINDHILRYLYIGVDEVPAEERELSAAEGSDDFVVPEPPADDAIDEPEEEEEESAAEASAEGEEDPEEEAVVAAAVTESEETKEA